ncbi:MAG: hypothetical protein IT371_10090 [Deltaproteobacteria bacterium]|nr:hypothetical protein [Deltaproteobacteria bacterium]
MTLHRNARLLALVGLAALLAPTSRAFARAEAPRGQAQPPVVTAEEAARMVGRNVYFAVGSAMPTSILRPIRLFAQQREGRTNAFYMSTFASAVNFGREVSEKFHPNLFFVSMSNREAATGGWATLHRDSLGALAKRINQGEFGIDTVVVRATPPDANGYVSFGPTSDLTMPAINAALRAGGKVIAEINPNMPRTRGDNKLHISQLSAVVEGNEVLAELTQMAPTVSEQAIAKNIGRLVPNNRRSTLQVGIGGSLVAIGEAMKNKRLRIWSEMGSDWVVDVMGRPKHKVSEAVFSFLLGTNNLYTLANNNERLRMESMLTVNDPAVIARQKRMVAVNTALEVDLAGNINAERIDGRIISFPGGQPNFMEGASRAPDGKAILGLRSINKYGESTIVTALHGPVTTPANHLDYLATEWGATRRLRGLNAAQRTYELISVAHPAHRKAMADAALTAGTLTQKQRDKLVRSVPHAIRLAAPQLARMGADLSLARGAITQAEYAQLTANLPPAENHGEGGMPLPPPPPPLPPANP